MTGVPVATARRAVSKTYSKTPQFAAESQFRPSPEACRNRPIAAKAHEPTTCPAFLPKQKQAVLAEQIFQIGKEARLPDNHPNLEDPATSGLFLADGPIFATVSSGGGNVKFPDAARKKMGDTALKFHPETGWQIHFSHRGVCHVLQTLR